MVADLGRSGREGVHGRPRQRAADADPLRPGFNDVAHRQFPAREDVDRLRDGVANRTDLLGGSQPRRVEHVRTRFLEGLQAHDRVL